MGLAITTCIPQGEETSPLLEYRKNLTALGGKIMVNDIRPEASVLLRQIANISQKRESGVGSQESRVRNLDSGLKSGVSVVEDVFNQIYSKSGFLKEEDVVPVKREQLGTRLDVYA